MAARRRTATGAAGNALAGLVAASRAQHAEAMIGAKWGVTARETALHYPCDDFVPSSALEAWRGVTVQAAPEAVWPWLAQVRVAPYSYDWIDNRGYQSPRRLLGLPEPRVGEAFTTTGRRQHGRILSVDIGRELTATVMGAFMSYLLLPAGQDTTRLLLKVVAPTNRWLAPVLSIGDLLMARRQLLNFKALAEGDGTQRRSVQTP